MTYACGSPSFRAECARCRARTIRNAAKREALPARLARIRAEHEQLKTLIRQCYPDFSRKATR